MDMKTNTLDIVLGPIETYEDELFGYKAANESFVLIKDQAWSQRLAKYATELPALQRGIPVDAAVQARDARAPMPTSMRTTSSTSPARPTPARRPSPSTCRTTRTVQLKKGTRRLQLKNAMRAKFDRILLPIARELIADDQLQHVTFDAFFENVMFHEVAHGLGIKNTLDGKGTVRAALKERARRARGREGRHPRPLHGPPAQRAGRDGPGERSRTTTSPSSRASSAPCASARRDAHGRANIVAFNFLQDMGAFTREPDGRYRVDFAKMRAAADALSREILTLQGNGDYAGVGAAVHASAAPSGHPPGRPRPPGVEEHPGRHRVRAGPLVAARSRRRRPDRRRVMQITKRVREPG